MAALSIAAIRGRVATAVAALDGWNESRVPPGRFGADTDQLLPQCFAVEIADTAQHPAPGRQTPSAGAYVDSTVVLAWAYRLVGDAPTTSLDAATAAEATVIAAVVGVSQADLHMTFLDATRGTETEGWLIGRSRFRALHRFALS